MKRKLILIPICLVVLFTAILSMPNGRDAEAGLLSGGQSTKSGAQAANVGLSPGTVRENPKDDLKYVWIPPGTFMMGCTPGDDECHPDEKPSHRVTLSKGFWIGQTEVTVGAYKRFVAATEQQMPHAPDFNKGWANDRMAIVNVNWNDAQAYCQWAGGRLPTEAEWEYAARAESPEGRHGDIDQIWWHDDESRAGTHGVARKHAHGFGLFDVPGDVAEWVNDWYDPDYYQNSPSQDPSGPPSGQKRVLRSGSWSSNPRLERVSFRLRCLPELRIFMNGLRCVREVNLR